jgi:hypothetical protein
MSYAFDVTNQRASQLVLAAKYKSKMRVFLKFPVEPMRLEPKMITETLDLGDLGRSKHEWSTGI